MIQNYLKIAWRNLNRYKVNSFVNIIGLSIGLTSVILIALYIQYELQYDTFFDDSDRIFRVNIDGKMGDNESYTGYTPPPAGRALVENFPEIEDYTRLFKPNADVLEVNTKTTPKIFNESNVYGVDSNFLQVLTYPLVSGDRRTCLSEAHSIVITQQVAHKYFGDTNPMGKTMYYGEDKQPLKVTGILDNLTTLPATVKFDMLIPVENFEQVAYFDWSWVWLGMATYVKLTDEAVKNPETVSRLDSKFPSMLKTQAAGAFERIGQPYDKFLENGNKWNLHLQPLTDIHLYSGDIISRISDQGTIQTLYILGIIAVFIILLACVNFTNLATAQATRRTREIGIRKVLGSPRKQLIKQFLTEAFLYTLISAVLGIILVFFTLPFFNSLSGKTIVFSSIFSSHLWIVYLGLIILTSFLAGIYPAFYLTSFKPVQTLKGSLAVKKKGILRNGLVVFQFVVAIGMILSTLVVYSQLRYTQTRDLGFDKENILIIDNARKLGAAEKSFVEELTQIPQVENATSSSGMFTKNSFSDFYVPQTNESGHEVDKDISLESYLVDNHFISTLNLQVAEGRGFDKRFNDSLSVVINTSAARQIGWENPIGQKIRYPGGNMEYYTIIGVLEDFNLESLHNPILPFALFSKTSQSYDTGTSYIAIKLENQISEELINIIETRWKEYAQDVPFEFSFLDENLNRAYASDKKLASLFVIFTILAIVVACLGLFGMVTFIAQQRKKEIGIRKVLGADVARIVRLLSMDFLKLILLSISIASPLAWYFMNNWLQDFAYRTTISWWIFLLGGGIALVIALVTISFQAIKAAMANPVNSLRSE